MSLKRTELLCLRISDGLGRQRDFEELRRRKIDVEGWDNLSNRLRLALQPRVLHGPIVKRVMQEVLSQTSSDTLPEFDFMVGQHDPELADSVIDQLDIVDSNLPIGQSLSSNVQPEIDERVFKTLELIDVDSSIGEALKPTRQPDLSEAIMSELLDEIIQIGAALKSSSQPDLSQRIMDAIDAPISENEAVEADIIDEHWLSQQESEIEFDIGAVLRPDSQVDLWDQLQTRLEISNQVADSDQDDNLLSFPGVQATESEPFAEDDLDEIFDAEFSNAPVAEVSFDELEEALDHFENKEQPLETLDGEVAIESDNESKDLSLSKGVVFDYSHAEVLDNDGPDYPEDDFDSEELVQESTSYGMLAVGLMVAVAAGLLLMFQFETPIEDSISAGEEVLSVAAVNELEVESLEVGDDVMVQIFQSEENAPTIIFIDDSLIVGENK
ncbi:MAG: hypothetical protein VXZ96_13180 [Myxococcota bacterium]|nr:hypothetical protein [Myxococcota bacterium]